jgi:hypothetical protein
MTSYLVHECLADALRECIAFCGGLKAVGSTLWPEKDADTAGRLLSDCLNDAKREKLSPEQVMLILRMSRERGCHAGMHYICRELGYAEPAAIEPEDARAELQRQFIESTKRLQRLAEQIERTGAPAAHGPVRVVAKGAA